MKRQFRQLDQETKEKISPAVCAKVQHRTAKTCQFEEKKCKRIKKIENHVQFFSFFVYIGV